MTEGYNTGYSGGGNPPGTNDINGNTVEYVHYPYPASSTYLHQEIQQSAPLTPSEQAAQPFPAYSGVTLLTNPQKLETIEPAIMGSPNLPVFIRVQKDPEPRYMRILHILQMVTGIFFVLFLIGLLLANSNSSSNLLDNSINSHHQIVKSSPVRFADVQGCDEIKAQMVSVVDYLKNPEKYEKFGAKMPRGYLLEGPPGVGKTLLAKAVAGEAQVPFLVISGAEFDEMFVGVGASRVRALFKDARNFNKAVVFIDEIDAVGGKRDGPDRSTSRQTMNQLLVEMDGFKTTSSVIVLAATNSVQSLDQALLRPGRFDKTLTLSPPDIAGRKQILRQLFAGIPGKLVGADINVDDLASTTIGYTGADLANLINQAKLIAATDGSAGVISKAHLAKAKNFIDLGPERSLVMTPKEIERTAYHEAGHAIVALASANSDPVFHATIVPHGSALGLVQVHSDTDKVYYSKAMLETKIDIALGGFVAEELKYGAENVSFGPTSDIAAVNQYARYMVSGGFGERTKFLRPLTNPAEASEEAKRNFEEDAQDIISAARARVHKLLNDQKAAWTAIAQALIEKETLDRSELDALFKKHAKMDKLPESLRPKSLKKTSEA